MPTLTYDSSVFIPLAKNDLSMQKDLNPAIGEPENNSFNMDSYKSRNLARKLDPTTSVSFSEYRNKPYGWLITFDKNEEVSFDLASWLKTAKLDESGWAGQPIRILIPSGVSVYSKSTASPAITISNPSINGVTSYKQPPVLEIYGALYGRGGTGGLGSKNDVTIYQYATAGSAGGTALKINCQTTLKNYGEIYGGGGGGGGGGGNFHRWGKPWDQGGGGGGGAPYGTGGVGGRANGSKGSLTTGGAGGKSTGGKGGNISIAGAGGSSCAHGYWFERGGKGAGGSAGTSIVGTRFLVGGSIWGKIGTTSQ